MMNMKKTLALLVAMTALSGAAYASPQTTFRPGEVELNAGMWDASARTGGYKSGGEWNFLGGVTYGLNSRWAAQYQYTGLSTDHTGGSMNEINMLYSLHPQVAAFGGWNRIEMKDFPYSRLNGGKATNNIFQVGVVARQPVTDVLDVYAKGALGTEETSMWEAGVNMAIDDNMDLNAGYRYMNTRGNSDHNVSYKGFLAGVSYRFGGHDPVEKEETVISKSYDYEEEEPEEVSVVRKTTESKAVEPVKAPENDYYMGSVHFDVDSADVRADQTINIDALVKKAKETGHTFKLVGRADATGTPTYNRELAAARIKSVKEYAVAQGVDAAKLIEMVKGSEGSTTSSNERRVDIFEHK